MKIKFALFALWMLFSSPIVHAETIFIFNPEARISQIKKVKNGLEKYLKSKGIYAKVYIFAHPEDFKNSIPRLKPDLAIVASYYFSSMERTYQWKAILSGHKKRAKRFRKVLVALKSINNLRQLKRKSLATVSLGFSSLPYIDSQLPTGLSTKDIRIIAVSKDVDAIMALGFEQVHAAIVTKTSFNKLKKINPDTVENLHILQELNPTLYPKVVVFPKAKQVKKLIAAFKDMPYKRSTRTVLRFFGISGFSAK